MYQSNQACGVANAATRKYLTQCHLWYFQPGEAVVAMAEWCQKFGKLTRRPYFSIDGETPPTSQSQQWNQLRARWHHTHGLTNIWAEPAMHSDERLRIAGEKGFLHANQKPPRLMERQIESCTDSNEVVWEPFGGLCSASVAAASLGRTWQAADIGAIFFQAARQRLISTQPSFELRAA